MAEKEKDTNAQGVPVDNSPFRAGNTFRTEEYRAIYANICAVSTTQWDFQILLGRGGRMFGETKVEEVATVYFSPAQAKALLGVFLLQMEKFESANGEIKLPDNVKFKLEAVKQKSTSKKK